MKTTLTLSVSLVHSVDKLARQMGCSRDDVFRKAMERYLEQEAATHGEAMDTVRGKAADRMAIPLIMIANPNDPGDEDW
jgi:metal-responsive CopG/Arc/MetJ family transcriptional regulator